MLPVEVNEVGVLTRVPARGIRTVDGPTVHLAADVVEWQAVSCFSAGVELEACAAGSEPDWAGRSTLEPVSYVSTPRGTVAVARYGAIELVNEYSLIQGGALLLARTTITNRGTQPLEELWFTREWRTDPGAGWTFPAEAVLLGAAPGDVCRMGWMFDELAPGATCGASFTFSTKTTPPRPSKSVGVEVPLVEWLPGFSFGETFGIATGDFDQDGWVDVFALQSAELWRNERGQSWTLANDLDPILPSTMFRYSVSWGDWDSDGLPDIATEARNCCAGDQCNHLLHNDGDAAFSNVTALIVDEMLCDADTETNCWGDVDGDGDLDLWLPTYPPTIGDNRGNMFLENLGPIGPEGMTLFSERAQEVGLFNVIGAARPEGAQFIDVDYDGDLDGYTGGILFQNDSDLGSPDFDAMLSSASGIGLASALEEGAAFFDYDHDGDFDLAAVYTFFGVRIWENRGDGTFFGTGNIIASPFTGLNLGLSIEDWDNDGDMDFTTRQVFRRNMFMETGGGRQFTVATHSIDPSHITSATPAWFDWDRDGDLDCALGNWFEIGRFYENELYDASTPLEERRHFRVRVLRDSDEVPRGLETEYGATVEVVVLDDQPCLRRKKFVASGHGYLNQNEYTLHFALPADPAPGVPHDDVNVDVIVDFPSLPAQGYHRVDKHVNPILGNLDVGSVSTREILVFRSGAVLIDGRHHPPAGDTPLMQTAGSGLVQPDPALGSPPSIASNLDLVGIDFDTLDGHAPQHIRQLIVDGRLGSSVTCAGRTGNVFLWDVTRAEHPRLAAAIDYDCPSRNLREWIPVDLELDVGRKYRLMAVTDKYRASPATPVDHGDLRVNGGVRLVGAELCDGLGIQQAQLDPTSLYLSFRFNASSRDRAPRGHRRTAGR